MGMVPCSPQVGKCRTPSQGDTLGTSLHDGKQERCLGLGPGKYKKSVRRQPLGWSSVLPPSFPAPPATLIPVETSRQIQKERQREWQTWGSWFERRQMKGKEEKVRRERSGETVGEPTGLRNQSSSSRGQPQGRGSEPP